jgi:hypothetical protein
LVAAAAAALFGLIGYLVAHFGGLGDAASGVGYGMCIGGALLGLLVGQSGSPTRMTMEGRSGAPGAAAQFWVRNPSLPQSPLWLVASAALVIGAGIAVIVLTS